MPKEGFRDILEGTLSRPSAYVDSYRGSVSQDCLGRGLHYLRLCQLKTLYTQLLLPVRTTHTLTKGLQSLCVPHLWLVYLAILAVTLGLEAFFSRNRGSDGVYKLLRYF